MDLTNIKPCVECAKRDNYCRQRCEEENLPPSLVQVHCVFVYGEDCFVEVDDGHS